METIVESDGVQYVSHGLSLSNYISLSHDVIVATMGAAARVLFKEEKKDVPDIAILTEMRSISRACVDMMRKSSNFEDIRFMGDIIKATTDTYFDILEFEKQNYPD